MTRKVTISSDNISPKAMVGVTFRTKHNEINHGERFAKLEVQWQ